MRRKSNVVSLIGGFFSSIFAFLGIVTCGGLPIPAGASAWSGNQLKIIRKFNKIMSLQPLAVLNK